MQAALAEIPAAAGVAQLLDRDGRSLLIGTASNLRRWAGAQLGLAAPGKKGARPRTNLRGIAGAVRWVATRGSFEQRLVSERLMDRHVPRAKRRDLKPPAYLRLDTRERFPRPVVSERAGDVGLLYGPFRDRRAATAARDALLKAHPLRPCDYAFEPDPALPLGLGCVYAQVRSCAAPCLARVSEPDYARLAREAALDLADPARRTGALAERVAAFVAGAGSRALVVERWRAGFVVFPIAAGSVLDAERLEVAEAELEAALGSLRFELPQQPPDDAPWLLQWLRGRRRDAAYLVVPDAANGSGSELAKRARSAFAALARGSEAAS